MGLQGCRDPKGLPVLMVLQVYPGLPADRRAPEVFPWPDPVPEADLPGDRARRADLPAYQVL